MLMFASDLLPHNHFHVGLERPRRTSIYSSMESSRKLRKDSRYPHLGNLGIMREE
jgi:hypothetical protein